MPDIEKTCETCRWWDQKPVHLLPTKHDGICRFASPAHASFRNDKKKIVNWRVFPHTFESDWCGQHAPREEE